MPRLDLELHAPLGDDVPLHGESVRSPVSALGESRVVPGALRPRRGELDDKLSFSRRIRKRHVLVGEGVVQLRVHSGKSGGNFSRCAQIGVHALFDQREQVASGILQRLLRRVDVRLPARLPGFGSASLREAGERDGFASRSISYDAGAVAHVVSVDLVRRIVRHEDAAFEFDGSPPRNIRIVYASPARTGAVGRDGAGRHRKDAVGSVDCASFPLRVVSLEGRSLYVLHIPLVEEAAAVGSGVVFDYALADRGVRVALHQKSAAPVGGVPGKRAPVRCHRCAVEHAAPGKRRGIVPHCAVRQGQRARPGLRAVVIDAAINASSVSCGAVVGDRAARHRQHSFVVYSSPVVIGAPSGDRQVLHRHRRPGGDGEDTLPPGLFDRRRAYERETLVQDDLRGEVGSAAGEEDRIASIRFRDDVAKRPLLHPRIGRSGHRPRFRLDCGHAPKHQERRPRYSEIP